MSPPRLHRGCSEFFNQSVRLSNLEFLHVPSRETVVQELLQECPASTFDSLSLQFLTLGVFPDLLQHMSPIDFGFKFFIWGRKDGKGMERASVSMLVIDFGFFAVSRSTAWSRPFRPKWNSKPKISRGLPGVAWRTQDWKTGRPGPM